MQRILEWSSLFLYASLNIRSIVLTNDNAIDKAKKRGLEPEEVVDRIFISDAFNSSQTYNLVMNRLDSFFGRVPIKLLVLPGLADLYHKEGLTSEGMQQITHMASRLMAFTLKRDMVTLVSAQAFPKNKPYPACGRALASCAQIHVQVEEYRFYVLHHLTKHPSFALCRVSHAKQDCEVQDRTRL